MQIYQATCSFQKFVAGLWCRILSSTLPKFILLYGSSTCLFLFLSLKNALIKLNLSFYQIKYESTIELYKKKLGKEYNNNLIYYCFSAFIKL